MKPSEARILATWIEALRRITDQPEEHLMAIRSWGTISYFVKKRPFKSRDIKRLKGLASQNLFDLVYYPGIKPDETNIYNQFEKPIYYDLTHQLLSPKASQKLYQDYIFQVKPVSDDKPFFYNFYKLNKIKATYTILGQKILPLIQGEYLVFILLAQAVHVGAPPEDPAQGCRGGGDPQEARREPRGRGPQVQGARLPVLSLLRQGPQGRGGKVRQVRREESAGLPGVGHVPHHIPVFCPLV